MLQSQICRVRQGKGSDGQVRMEWIWKAFWVFAKASNGTLGREQESLVVLFFDQTRITDNLRILALLTSQLQSISRVWTYGYGRAYPERITHVL